MLADCSIVTRCCECLLDLLDVSRQMVFGE
jgi:hypothetical protein